MAIAIKLVMPIVGVWRLNINRHESSRLRNRTFDLVSSFQPLKLTGILHGDLNTENLMLTADMDLVVTDYGISKLKRAVTEDYPE